MTEHNLMTEYFEEVRSSKEAREELKQKALAF